MARKTLILIVALLCCLGSKGPDKVAAQGVQTSPASQAATATATSAPAWATATQPAAATQSLAGETGK